MDKKTLTLREDIIKNYDKFDALYFSKKYNVTLNWVYCLATKLKATRTYYNNIENHKNELIEDYLNGLTLEELGNKYHHYEANIRDFLEKSGIPIKISGSWQKLYTWDTTFFKKIDSHEKAYWLGFIYADGNVRKKDDNQGLFQIALAKKDVLHLEKLRKSLKSNHPIYKDREARRIIISQHEIYNDLIRLGVSERKSLTLIPPSENQVSKQFINSFLLGYFDGDGSIFYSKKKKNWGMNIIGTLELCKFFRDFLSKNGVSHLTLRQEKRTKNKNIWYLSTGGGFRTKKGKKKIKIIYNAIYKDSPIFMDRKKEKFEFCLNYYE